MPDLDADPRLHVFNETINEFNPRASSGREGGATLFALADVAQLVEHFTRNEGVPDSSTGVGLLSI